MQKSVIIIISLLYAYSVEYSFPFANGQQINITEVDINGTIFYSTSGNSTTIQLEGKSCEYFVSLEGNPMCVAYVEEYPLNDGFCDMLNKEQARYCADPGLIQKEEQDRVNQNKWDTMYIPCYNLEGELIAGKDPMGYAIYEGAGCKLPEGYLIPLEYAFELRDYMANSSTTREDVIRKFGDLTGE